MKKPIMLCCLFLSKAIIASAGGVDASAIVDSRFVAAHALGQLGMHLEVSNKEQSPIIGQALPPQEKPGKKALTRYWECFDDEDEQFLLKKEDEHPLLKKDE